MSVKWRKKHRNRSLFVARERGRGMLVGWETRDMAKILACQLREVVSLALLWLVDMLTMLVIVNGTNIQQNSLLLLKLGLKLT